MSDYRNPNHPLNGPRYHTSKKCIEYGCTDPAGTAWSPFWCWKHNAERIDRITNKLKRLKVSSSKV
jgi:hypothetical protein